MSASAILRFSLDAPAVSSQVALTFTASSSLARYEASGAATHVVDLAAMPAAGLRGLLIVFDAIDADGAAVVTPISIAWTSNSVAKVEELSPGGFLALASPSPVHGITALSIVTTAKAVVAVYALG